MSDRRVLHAHKRRLLGRSSRESEQKCQTTSDQASKPPKPSESPICNNQVTIPHSEQAKSYVRIDPTKLCLLDLPGEIRNMIYAWALEQHIDSPKQAIGPLPPGLVLINRQIHREISSWMWSLCEVIVDDMIQLAWITAKMGPSNASYVRHVHFHGLLEGCKKEEWLMRPWAVAYADTLAPFVSLERVTFSCAGTQRDADRVMRIARCLYFCTRGWLEVVGEREGDRFAALTEERITVSGGSTELIHGFYLTKEVLVWLRMFINNPPIPARLRSATRKLPGREVLPEYRAN